MGIIDELVKVEGDTSNLGLWKATIEFIEKKIHKETFRNVENLKRIKTDFYIHVVQSLKRSKHLTFSSNKSKL